MPSKVTKVVLKEETLLWVTPKLQNMVPESDGINTNWETCLLDMAVVTFCKNFLAKRFDFIRLEDEKLLLTFVDKM